MIQNKTVACVIPARLASTRFPRKMLAQLGGKPLLQWVWEAATATRCFDSVVIAVDSQEVADLVTSFGGKWIMTAVSCANGTERLIEVQASGVIDADVWVCWQGDEPFITEEMIGNLLQTAGDDQSDVWTLKKRITDPERIASPHVVKVVTDINDHALYFSRSTIPFYRDARQEDQKFFYKHIGIYAYSTEALKTIARLPLCPLEEAEQLENLRFLFNGLRVRVHETHSEVVGIDLPEHLALAESHLASRSFL
jgi:3-deoxy-manno-octulosonate cytidylyltransferase (CMP-KDO synthetase)